MGNMGPAPVRILHPHVELRSQSPGTPFVRGTQLPVRRLWSWHRAGVAIEVLLKRYPNVGPAAMLDALSFAYDNQELIEADLEREREFLRREAEDARLSRG
jgi:uncharacterized protein (DUF433 family)